MPALGWRSHPGLATEALLNGIPVLASDRGALPELLGSAGMVLSLPDRLTPVIGWLPTAEEVAPWVEAVIRLWDDAEFALDHRRRAVAESQRWAPDVLETSYAEFFQDLRSGGDPLASAGDARAGAAARTLSERVGGCEWRVHEGHPHPAPVHTGPPPRSKSVVLIPHMNGIDWECEQSLRGLEEAGVHVIRRPGCSAIDEARNILTSDALHEGFEAIMFIDSDMGFDPQDALRLLARPEPVVLGVYAKKAIRALATYFAEGVPEIQFGADAQGLYPVKYAAAGFLRIRASVLRRMIDELKLPLCNTHWGRGVWPFFMPMIIPHGPDKKHYLSEDWAFSHRLGQIGVTPLADTSIRLWHWGRYAYSWEDAGTTMNRFRSYRLSFDQEPKRPEESPPDTPAVEPERSEEPRETAVGPSLSGS
jgi:hypothetical protein